MPARFCCCMVCCSRMRAVRSLFWLRNSSSIRVSVDEPAVMPCPTPGAAGDRFRSRSAGAPTERFGAGESGSPLIASMITEYGLKLVDAEPEWWMHAGEHNNNDCRHHKHGSTRLFRPPTCSSVLPSLHGATPTPCRHGRFQRGHALGRACTKTVSRGNERKRRFAFIRCCLLLRASVLCRQRQQLPPTNPVYRRAL